MSTSQGPAGPSNQSAPYSRTVCSSDHSRPTQQLVLSRSPRANCAERNARSTSLAMMRALRGARTNGEESRPRSSVGSRWSVRAFAVQFSATTNVPCGPRSTVIAVPSETPPALPNDSITRPPSAAARARSAPLSPGGTRTVANDAGRRSPTRSGSNASQVMCRARHITCDAFDPLLVGDRRLASFATVLVPPGESGALRARAAALGGRVIESFGNAGGVSDGTAMTVLRGPHGTFVVAENWTANARTLHLDPTLLRGRLSSPFVLAPRSARIIASDVDLAFLSAQFARGDRLSTSCRVGREWSDEHTVRLYGADWFDGPAGPCEVDMTLHGARTRRKIEAASMLTLRPGAQPERVTIIVHTTYLRDKGIRLARNIDAVVSDRRLRGGSSGPRAYRADVFEDGAGAIVVQNDRVAAVLAPAGGARAISFAARRPYLGVEAARNLFDATGGLRDDVLVQPPPSTTDRIAQYTHLYPAGTFNRTYDGCT